MRFTPATAEEKKDPRGAREQLHGMAELMSDERAVHHQVTRGTNHEMSPGRGRPHPQCLIS